MQQKFDKNINAVHIIKVSDETKKEIFSFVENSYKNDIKEMIIGKTCWRRTGITFETLSKITIVVGGVLSFSSGYFNSNILSFISGSVSVISLALLQFGSFGFKQAKKRANDLNILLKKLDLDTVPVIDSDPEALTIGNNKTTDNKGILNNDLETMHSLSDNLEETKNEPDSSPKKNTEGIDIKNIDLELMDNSPISNKTKNINIIEDTIHLPSKIINDVTNIL